MPRSSSPTALQLAAEAWIVLSSTHDAFVSPPHQLWMMKWTGADRMKSDRQIMSASSTHWNVALQYDGKARPFFRHPVPSPSVISFETTRYWRPQHFDVRAGTGLTGN